MSQTSFGTGKTTTNYVYVLQTKDFTPIQPDVFEYEYCVPGVGVILEEGYQDGKATGERVELVEMIRP